MIQQILAEVNQFALENRIGDAKRRILEGVRDLCVQHNFLDADRLRRRLTEIDPMDLGDTILAAEIVETFKKQSVSQADLRSLTRIREILLDDEFSDFYYCLTKKAYRINSIIYSQGEFSSQSYLIDSGSVRLHYSSETAEVLVDTLGMGRIFGCSEFFNASVRTLTASAASDCVLYELDLKKFDLLSDTHPALFPKFHNYCLQEAGELKLSLSTSDRRKATRYAITAPVLYQVFISDTKVVDKKFKGELIDVSESGIAFKVFMSSHEDIRLLLGRKIRARVGRDEYLEATAKIMSLRSQSYSTHEYTVHAQFERLLSRLEIKNFVQATAGPTFL